MLNTARCRPKWGGDEEGVRGGCQSEISIQMWGRDGEMGGGWGAIQQWNFGVRLTDHLEMQVPEMIHVCDMIYTCV